MAIIATLWSPSLDLVGPASVLAAVFSALVICVVDLRRPVFDKFRPAILLLSMMILTAFIYLSDAGLVGLEELHLLQHKHRRFPGADDFVGNYIALALGLMIGWRLFRLETRWLRAVGLACMLVFAAVILAEVVGLSYWSRSLS